jgi:DNA-binding NarL/FixJ family response regulator
VTSLVLMKRIVPIVAPLALVSDLDFEGDFALDALQELHRTHPAIRIVAYSGHSNDVTRQMVGKAGLFAFVAKLDSLDLLRARIDEACVELAGEPGLPVQTRSRVSEARRRLKPHDMGARIRWALDSGFKPGAISRILQVSPQTVAYHAKGQNGTRSP